MSVLASLMLALVQWTLLFFLLYQYLLALASIRQLPEPLDADPPATRFAIAIPAHNEASVLASTLADLWRQAYSKDLFDVHVVADHCTDDTVEVARSRGAIVHERQCQPQGRKAYALQWLLERLLGDDSPYDAVAIFDADSLVAPDFLAVMDHHLNAGARVLQGQHIISNPEDSPLAAMAAVDMRLNNRLRNTGRSNLGFSCRLMGDAMVFDACLLYELGWPAESLTEDREFGYELLLRGLRVRYVPQAQSRGQAASAWRQAEPQRLRWYQGLVAMQRRLAPQLLRGALKSRSLILLDGALELLAPSFTFLVTISLANLGLVTALRFLLPSVQGLFGIGGAALLLAGWLIYPLVGLLIDRAPGWAFRALLLGPIYLFWRLWISVLVRLRGDSISWVRTRRREETDGPV